MGLLQSSWLQTSTPQSRATGKNYIRRMSATGRFQNPCRHGMRAVVHGILKNVATAKILRREFDLPQPPVKSLKQYRQSNRNKKQTMKKYSSIIMPLIMSGFLATATRAFGQGSLTPPGAPSQTMKSLDQIEPRTPISYDGYNINSPGSYYVTTNLTGSAYGVPGSPYGIYIASDNVTIDLNGFTLQGVPGSYSGIYIYGSHTNITVRNGIVTGWGGNGVTWNYPSTPPPQNVVLEHLTVYANANHGIVTANGCIVSDCLVMNNGFDGIFVYGNGSQIIGNTLIGNAANIFGGGGHCRSEEHT